VYAVSDETSRWYTSFTAREGGQILTLDLASTNLVKRDNSMNSEEIAQFRSYLTSQSMKRTPVQIYDALEEAYRQLLETVDQFPETAFTQPYREGVWSIAEIVEHVMLFMASYEQAICMLLEQGLQPPDVNDRSENLLRQEPVKRLELLRALQSSLQHLAHTIHQTEPASHLEVTWKHFELGALHWREWLLLARVHLLDHVRQLQTMRLNSVESWKSHLTSD